MSRVLGTIKKKSNNGPGIPAAADGETPEATAARCVKLFCESGSNNSGDEVLFLPPIVDAAESSPVAAQECARLIRKYLKKDYWTAPSYQYNAIMLTRILADNPGQTFTRNIDQKFTDTTKDLLKNARDPSVRQMMMETLEAFEATKAYDEGLTLIIDMWKKEKEKIQKQYGRQPTQLASPPAPQASFNPHSQNYFARNHSNRKLPDPVELASRLEEARTSAKLLQQVVTNTPPVEVLSNDLIKEFADRCTSASRSIQMYMTAENPAPDNDTMESLIDTNEQLQAALSLHQRAMLNARKIVAAIEPPAREPVSPIESERNGSASDLASAPPRKSNGKGKERERESAAAGPSRTHTPAAEDDPFRDPEPEQSGSGSQAVGRSSNYQDEPRLAFEPFHPGFDTLQGHADRPDGGLGKETMRGASGSASRRSRDYDDDDDDDDNGSSYNGASSKKKEPIYRY
ncbi:hypothetical protein GGS23DRAFT_592987 [Durotheca rogersii]|uniref:uncharacterized protein n=1 Tax=Durotheca rogersii TaxID=419775 RepID=UPI002220C128|nr:uncharacterized protein GGS23DRAFT_592987 [Durotheca rogersii]KAI5867702.1 hypothetical protein GGS23DRAFT_592987 [Durotheca rogersii]